MPRRAAVVTQADIARATRAVQAAGLPVMRIVVRSNGVAVETVLPPNHAATPNCRRRLPTMSAWWSYDSPTCRAFARPIWSVRPPATGTVVWYVRVGQGPRTRMREAYGSPEFWRDYRLAVEGRPRAPAAGPKPGTLSWLIAKYVASAEWSELKPATRKQRHEFYRAMEKTAGDEPLALINRRAILAGRDRRRDTPYAANNFLKSLRGLFRWAWTPTT